MLQKSLALMVFIGFHFQLKAESIQPLSQRSALEIPNQTEFDSFSDLKDKRRLAIGPAFNGLSKDFAMMTDVHLFKDHSIRASISPNLNNLLLSAGLKAWINHDQLSPYWAVEGWYANRKSDSNSNGIAGSVGAQYNLIEGETAGSSFFLEGNTSIAFKDYKLKLNASTGFIYHF